MGQDERLYAKATYSSGSPTEQWTVGALHPGGWGQGREVSPSPHKPDPGHDGTEQGEPPSRQTGMSS